MSKGTHEQVVAASLCRGNLWRHIKFLHLRHNMCLGHSEADNHHAQWLLEIGAGSTMDDNEMIQVSQSMFCANLIEVSRVSTNNENRIITIVSSLTSNVT